MKISSYAPVVVRLGLTFVFIWFGASQIMNQAMWTSLIPSYATDLTGLSASTVVLINGILEVVLAVLLAFGIRIRIVATLLALHLIGIIGTVGLNGVGIRDIGLMLAMFSVALHGADEYSFDRLPQSF
jgi:uncharacterized membrane protein YphA (DoxX/SURF4 family)